LGYDAALHDVLSQRTLNYVKIYYTYVMRFLLGISPAFSTRTPGRCPKENTLHIKHGESLKSRIYYTYFQTKLVIAWDIR